MLLKNPQRKPIRKKWHSSPSTATTRKHSARTSSPASAGRHPQNRGVGTLQRGMGLLSMAAAAETPASSHLRRLLTVVNGVEDPAAVLGPKTYPEQEQSVFQSEDSLDDVRAYLQTMKSHVALLENASGLKNPKRDSVADKKTKLRKELEELNLRNRPMTSPQLQHRLSRHDAMSQPPLSQSKVGSQRRPQSSAATTLQSHGPKLVDMLRPGSPSHRRQIERDNVRRQKVHLSVAKRRRQLSAQRVNASPSATLTEKNLSVDKHTGIPIVSKRLLRNTGPSFEEEMEFFVQLYMKRKLMPDGIKKIQAWRRGLLRRRAYLKWKARRRLRLHESFRVWYLSQRFRSLKKRSSMRRCWVVWKNDHLDLAATKRLIGRLMKQNLKSNNAMMMNILTSAQGSAAMGDLRAHSTNIQEREAFERMVADANRILTMKCFEAWQYRVVQMQRLSKRVAVHLQRVQRQVLASRNVTVMWPAERVGMLLKMWRRYTRFQASVRDGADTGEPPKMQWKDLPHMDAWDEWVIDFEQTQIRAFKAASLGPMAVVRRMLMRMKLFVKICKQEREHLARANNHYKNFLSRRVLFEWSDAARQRGKQMRLLRKVINVWWAYARREVQLRHRADMVRSRLQDRQMGDLLVQWRWRRCTHACVTSTGLHYLLQPRNKFRLLRCIYAWRDTAFGDDHVKQGVHSPDRLQFVLLKCWRGWTQ